MNAETIQWAQGLIAGALDDAVRALRKFCAKPHSAKRLHRARKQIARLRAALADLPSGDGGSLVKDVRRLHRCAGKIRDADVLLERVRAYRRSAGKKERRELDCIAALLKKRRAKARRKLEKLLRRSHELAP